MNATIRKGLYWLDSKNATITVIIFSILNKVIYVLLTSSVGRDKLLQLSVTENIISGNGIGVFKYYTHDIYTPVFDKVVEFPPGYSYIMIPFVQLFNHDYYAASAAYDIIIAIFLLFVLRWICRLSGFSAYMTNLFTIIYGCFQYIYFSTAAPTDATGLLLVFFGIGVIIKLAQKNKKLTTLQFLLVGLLFFSPTFFRFMYLPISFLLPGLLILFGYKRSNRQMMKQGSFLFLLTALFIAIMILSLRTYSGYGMPQYPIERGFFPSNILRWYPFIPASFINLDFVSVQIEKLSNLKYQNVFVLFELLNILLFIFLTLLIYQTLKQIDTTLSFKIFILSGSVISMVILLSLLYSSLTYTSKARDSGAWTFVYEERHFGFIYLFLQIAFLGWLYFFGRYRGTIILRRIVFSLLAFLVIIECAHGFYYNVKSIFNYKEEKIFQNHDADYRAFDKICSDLKQKNPDTEVLVASQDWFFCQKAVLSGTKGIYDALSLNNNTILVKRKSILLVIIPEDRLVAMNKYINEKKPTLLSSVLGTGFYLQEINPQ